MCAIQVRWLASLVVPPGNECSPASGRRHTSTNKKKYQHTVLGTDRNEVVGYSLVVPPIGYKLGGCTRSQTICICATDSEYRSHCYHLLFELSFKVVALQSVCGTELTLHTSRGGL